MNTPYKTESLPAVTAAGVVAMLFSAFGVLCGLLVEISMLLAPRLQTSLGSPAIPPGTRVVVQATWLLGLGVAVFGFFVGIGVLRRRNWARITMLVWGGIMAVFSAISIPFIFLVFNSMPLALPNGEETAPIMGFMKVFMVFFYGIPLGVGIWWLVLFTRPRVAAAFVAPASLEAPAYSPALDVTGFPLREPAEPAPVSLKASCPLPLMILAGFLVFSSAFMLLAVLFPMTGSMPFFFFGHLFTGITAKVLLGLMGVVFGAGGIGILKLKPAALHTVLVLYGVFFINGILSLLNPHFLAAVQEATQRLDAQNPAFAGGNPFLTEPFFRSMMIFGLCFSAAIIALLLFYRSRFLEAASKTGN
jgi:hypothetical protein